MRNDDLNDINWCAVFAQIQIQTGLNDDDLDEFLKEKWGVEITRNSYAIWNDISQFTLDMDRALLMLLEYPPWN